MTAYWINHKVIAVEEFTIRFFLVSKFLFTQYNAVIVKRKEKKRKEKKIK